MVTRAKILAIKFIYIAIDAACLYSAIYVSCLLRQKLLNFPVSFSYLFLDPQNPFRLIFLFWVVATILFMNSNHLYQTRREVVEGIEIWLVIKSVFLSAMVTIATIYSLKIYGFPRTVFMNAGLGMVILLSVWRVFKRWLVEYLVSQGYNNFNALILGAGKVGVALAEEIKSRPGLGLKVVGFLDDYKGNDPRDKNVRIAGKISDFSEIARKEFVHTIFVTIYPEGQSFLQVLQQARDMGIAVRVIPQGFDMTTGEFFKFNIGFIPVIEYCGVEYSKKQFGKRMFDFIVSLSALTALLPVLLVIGTLIKLDSRGPVLYRSKRYGRRGNIFYMYKFRSMVEDADQHLDKLKEKNEADGPIFKIRQDPRVTDMGRFLRKYSLDELPQIINVLIGDMSLVGPRPFPIEQIEKEDLNQLKRLEVRPGITGLWQVRGRSDISFARLVRWDIWYINNWSFWLDLNILFQTIPVVIHGKGAY